ncbi:unnamed protein product, partial [Anisakis simplex]|uniref:Uncharacterized protein n=1 Tax=Anisakis simplex TaxID=6269 RepID=A0A0M3JG23_ANISI
MPVSVIVIDIMLIELLYFADRYGCWSFLIEILNVILRMPYDLMILRDLYEVSRSIANDEFNNKIDLLSAYLLPLMITCGFTEQLTPDELIRLEYQYTFNIKHEQNSHSKDVDCKRHELALKLFQEVSSKLFSNAETNESEYY